MRKEHVCEICGEPMPPGEEMFKFHGYSCNCPKPPIKTQKAARITLKHETIVVCTENEITADLESWVCCNA